MTAGGIHLASYKLTTPATRWADARPVRELLLLRCCGSAAALLLLLVLTSLTSVWRALSALVEPPWTWVAGSGPPVASR